MREWFENKFGKWWVEIWESNTQCIAVGVGEPFLAEGYAGAYFVKIKRWSWFWISVAKPTLEHLKSRG